MLVKGLYYDNEYTDTDLLSKEGIEEIVITRLIEKIEQLEDSNQFYIEEYDKYKELLRKVMVISNER